MIRVRSTTCHTRGDYIELALETDGDRALAVWRISPTDRPGVYQHVLYRRGEELASALNIDDATLYFGLKLGENPATWEALDILRWALQSAIDTRWSLPQRLLQEEYERGYEDGFRAQLDAHKQRRAAAPTFVYLAERPGRLKIGVAADPVQRAASLSTTSGETVSVVATRRYPDRAAARKAERQAHERFAAHRTLGEWFEDVPEIRAYFQRRKP